MSQFEFVSRLRRCLAGLPEEEIDRAVEYYEDYFADAGESDEKVIEKLGSPEELAENIRRELSEKQEKINGVKEEDQGVFTEHGFETKQDREHYQQLDKFTQLEKKENPFEKKEETKNNTENKEQRTSYSGQYNGQYHQNTNQKEKEYHYNDKKERKKNRRFITILVMVFGFVWICIALFCVAIYILLFGGKKHSKEQTATEYAEEILKDLEDIDPIEEFSEAVGGTGKKADNDGDTVSGTAAVLPDQDIQELKIKIGAGKVLIQEGGEFALSIRKNSNNAKIKSKVKDGVWKIEEEDNWNFDFSLKDLKDIAKKMKKGIKKGVSILITVPMGFQADKIDIKVDAGKVVAQTLLAEEADFEVSAGTIQIEDLTVTEELDLHVGMGKVDISNGSIHNLDLDCHMGKVSLQGTLRGENKIDCNMGTVELRLENSASDYSFFAENDMGTVNINGENYSGFSSKEKQGDGDTKVELDVNMGTIEVTTDIGS